MGIKRESYRFYGSGEAKGEKKEDSEETLWVFHEVKMESMKQTLLSDGYSTIIGLHK